MTITRTITLTDEEIRSIVQEEHRKDIRYEVEQTVQVAEEDGIISFSCWASVPFSEYTSEEDARSDFIDMVTNGILENEKLYDHNPSPFSYNYDDEVYDEAKYCGYLKGE